MNTPFALIIEDDIDLSTIFSEALKSAGFKTQTIQDGQIATQQLQILTPDVIVLDLHLPHTSGVDLMNQIRADKRMAKTRVIVSTADPRLAEIVGDKADLVLIKPVSFSQLRDLSVRMLLTLPNK